MPVTVLREADEPIDPQAVTGWSEETTRGVTVRTVVGGPLFPDGAWRMVCEAVAAEVTALGLFTGAGGSRFTDISVS